MCREVAEVVEFTLDRAFGVASVLERLPHFFIVPPCPVEKFVQRFSEGLRVNRRRTDSNQVAFLVASNIGAESRSGAKPAAMQVATSSTAEQLIWFSRVHRVTES